MKTCCHSSPRINPLHNVVIRSFGRDILWVDGQFRTSSTGCYEKIALSRGACEFAQLECLAPSHNGNVFSHWRLSWATSSTSHCSNGGWTPGTHGVVKILICPRIWPGRTCTGRTWKEHAWST